MPGVDGKELGWERMVLGGPREWIGRSCRAFAATVEAQSELGAPGRGRVCVFKKISLADGWVEK